MQKYLFKNIQVVNEGKIKTLDVLISQNRIERIDSIIDAKGNMAEINGEGKHLFQVLLTIRCILESRA